MWTRCCLFVILVAVLQQSGVLCNTKLSNKGQDFCLGFRSIIQNGLTFSIIISTDDSTSVDFTITYSGGTVTHQTVKDSPYIAVLDTLNANVADSSYAYRNHGVCIESTSAPLFITAYTRLTGTDATASFLALPYQEIVGEQYEYYAMSVSGSSSSYYSGVVITAFKDNTSITIYPSLPLNIPDNTQDINSIDIVIGPGESHTVILDRRQTLYIGKDGGADVTGTRIVSDKPLTVISGHEAGSVPNDGSLEPMAQQIPPTQLWGDRFMIAPLQGSLLGSLIKVVAANDHTELSYECSGGESGIVNITEAGGSTQFSVSTDAFCYIEASNVLLVGQFPKSPSSSNEFDTTMIIVSSIEQYTPDPSFYTLNNTSNGNEKYYISIIVPANYYQEDAILYDGSVITHDNWVAVNYNGTVMGYGCTLEVETLSSKPHTVSRADASAHFLVIAYGFQTSRAYGYVAGLTIPADKVLGFKLSTEFSYSTVEFDGSISLSAYALHNIPRDVTFSYTTMPLYGITPGNDYTSVNEQEIVYKAHTDGFMYTIDILDDHVTEADETLRVDLCTEFGSETFCFENTLTIVDNDVIVIGLSDIVYNSMDNELKVTVAVQSGQLQPSYFVEVELNSTVSFQDEPLISFMTFNGYTKSHTIDYSLGDVAGPFEVAAVLEDNGQSTLLLELQPNTKNVMITPQLSNPTVTCNQQTTHSNNINSIASTSIASKETSNITAIQTTLSPTDDGIAPSGEGIASTDEAGLLADNFLINVIIPIAAGVAIFIIVALLCGIITARYLKKRKNHSGVKTKANRYELPTNQPTAIRNEDIDTTFETAMPRLVLVNPRHSGPQGGRGGGKQEYLSVPLHEMATPPAKEVEKGDEVPVYEVVEGEEEKETQFNTNDGDEERSSSEEDDSSTESIN